MLRFLSSIALVAAVSSLWAEEFVPEADTPQISLEVRIMSVPTSNWQRLGLKANTLVPPQADEAPVELDRAEIGPGQQAIQLVSAVAVTESRPPVSCQVMSPSQLSQLIQVVQGERRSNISFAPKITVFSGQTAHVRSTNRRPFVVDLEDVSDQGEPAKESVVKEFDEGTILTARADVCEDGSVDLALLFDAVQIREVRTSRVGESHVQVPETRSMKFQLASHLRSDETLAIWSDELNTTKETKGSIRKWYGAKGSVVVRESSPLVLLITPRVIEVEEVAEAESK